MKQEVRIALASVFVSIVACAQTPAPSFAAVSVKPMSQKDFAALLMRSQPDVGTVLFQPGGRLMATGVTVPMLVAAAYGLPFPTPRMSGDSVGERIPEHFTVEAVVDPGTIPEDLSPAQLRKKMQPMLRQLLAERFKLVLRTESKEMGVFKLTVAPGGPKLTKSSVSEAECASSTIACNVVTGSRMQGMRGDAMSMDDVAFTLERSSDLPVVDGTGIKGLFSIKMGSYSRLTPDVFPEEIERLPPERRPPPEPWPSVFKVLEESLGLRLESGRAQVDILRIESVQRPDAN